MLDQKINALIAIGASVGANCIPCLEYHKTSATRLGATATEIGNALAIGVQVRKGAAGKIDEIVASIVGDSIPTKCESPCSCS